MLEPRKPTASSSTSAEPHQAVLIGRFSKRMANQLITSTMSKKLKISDERKTSLQNIAKGFCLSVAHNGVNKRISEATTIEIYKTAYQGIVDHSRVMKDNFKKLYEIKETVMSPSPQECCLDKNNILKYESLKLTKLTPTVCIQP